MTEKLEGFFFFPSFLSFFLFFFHSVMSWLDQGSFGLFSYDYERGLVSVSSFFLLAVTNVTTVNFLVGRRVTRIW